MLRQASTIAYYTLLEALRNRLMWLLGLIPLTGIAVSGFLGELAVTESAQVQVALLAAFFRLAAVFLVATFVVTSLVRELNYKGLGLVLALPLPRAGYVLGKLAGFAALAVGPAEEVRAASNLASFPAWTGNPPTQPSHASQRLALAALTTARQQNPLTHNI